jgi:hypothetical protein
MNEFDTPPFVYEKMFGTDDIYYFNAIEKQKLNRGIYDDRFINLILEVDNFVTSVPDVFVRSLRSPEPSILAAGPTSPIVPSTSPTPGVSGRFDGLDFFGRDFDNKGIRNISLFECQNFCRNNQQCAAYSYVTRTRWCWPKYGVENFSLANGVISGILDYSRVNSEVFERPFTESTAMDILGYDMYPRGLRNMSLNQCRNACQATEGCIAFSWVADKSWCFPKYGAGQLTERLGIISGVKN